MPEIRRGNTMQRFRGHALAGWWRSLFWSGARRGGAQYTAPPPEPGFTYIFDGTATGSDASFDKWAFAARHRRAVRRRRAVRARRRSTPSRARSSSAPRRSAPTGTRSAVRQRRVPAPVHGPEHADGDAQRRHHDPHARDPLHGRQHHRRPRPEADGLQLRRLPGALPICKADDARRRRRPTRGRAPRPVPAGVERVGPAVRVHGRLLRAQPATETSPTSPGPAR